jgi:hypothetical protein
MDVRMIGKPVPNPAGFVTLRLVIDQHEVTAIISPVGGVGVADPPSFDVEKAGMAFAADFARTKPILVQRVMMRVRRDTAELSEGRVMGTPTVDGSGRACFRVDVRGRVAAAVVSASLVPVVARWSEGAVEMTEEDWSAIYDCCLSYMDENVDALRSLGFETEELIRQQNEADEHGPLERQE